MKILMQYAVRHLKNTFQNTNVTLYTVGHLISDHSNSNNLYKTWSACWGKQCCTPFYCLQCFNSIVKKCTCVFLINITNSCFLPASGKRFWSIPCTTKFDSRLNNGSRAHLSKQVLKSSRCTVVDFFKSSTCVDFLPRILNSL